MTTDDDEKSGDATATTTGETMSDTITDADVADATDLTDASATDQNEPDGSKDAEGTVGRWWARPASSGVRTTGTLLLIAALVIIAAIGFWQAADQREQLQALQSANADAAKAQEVASGYAVKAAAIDYRNFDPWFASLTSGVAKPVADQFTASEPALRDLLGQLQWVSTGTLVGSDIKSQNDGTYVVQVFVDVTTSNVQSPDGVKTTALYPITLDKKSGWQITDISGGVAPLPGK